MYPSPVKFVFSLLKKKTKRGKEDDGDIVREKDEKNTQRKNKRKANIYTGRHPTQQPPQHHNSNYKTGRTGCARVCVLGGAVWDGEKDANKCRTTTTKRKINV